MSWIRGIRDVFELLFQRQKKDADLDAEVNSYFEIMVAHQMEQGMSREEASAPRV